MRVVYWELGCYANLTLLLFAFPLYFMGSSFLNPWENVIV